TALTPQPDPGRTHLHHVGIGLSGARNLLHVLAFVRAFRQGLAGIGTFGQPGGIASAATARTAAKGGLTRIILAVRGKLRIRPAAFARRRAGSTAGEPAVAAFSVATIGQHGAAGRAVRSRTIAEGAATAASFATVRH